MPFKSCFPLGESTFQNTVIKTSNLPSFQVVKMNSGLFVPFTFRKSLVEAPNHMAIDDGVGGAGREFPAIELGCSGSGVKLAGVDLPRDVPG